MKMTELAVVMNKELVLKFIVCGALNLSWRCSFEHGEVKNGGCLESAYGCGETVQEALYDYAKQIVGRVLVFNATNDDRQEFTVPETLEAIL